jgi:hypothetical protein
MYDNMSKNLKSTKIATVIAGAILIGTAYLFGSGKLSDLQTYAGAVIIARDLLQDISTPAAPKIAAAGMFSEFRNPADLQLLGQKYTAKIYYCPLPDRPLADMPPGLRQGISMLDCRATTPVYRQVEIEISHQGKRIYNLPTAIVDRLNSPKSL